MRASYQGPMHPSHTQNFGVLSDPNLKRTERSQQVSVAYFGDSKQLS